MDRYRAMYNNKEIITDSLWIFDKRDDTGAHDGWYWGNFIPQIPRQLMLRYTVEGDWVLDPFCGSGTTLIECRRLGRNGIGIDINKDVVKRAKLAVEKEPNPHNVITEVIAGDSKTIAIRRRFFSLVIMHPPYHDIIKFSDNKNDLSRVNTIPEFLSGLSEVVDNTCRNLKEKGILGLVVGDKYAKGKWIPLGFLCMNEILKKKSFTLKSIVVKNIKETRGKRNQYNLWRYRAIKGGYYVFRHEYIFIFQM